MQQLATSGKVFVAAAAASAAFDQLWGLVLEHGKGLVYCGTAPAIYATY